METRVEIRETATWVYVIGRLDTETAPEFDTRLDALVREGHRNLVFDLGQLEYVSSAGLSCFIAVSQRLEPDGGSVALISLQSFVQRVFEISRLTEVFRICTSADEL